MCEISDDAIAFILELIEQTEDKSLKPTLLSAGAGCGTPVIKLEMQTPLEDDEIIEKSDINIHARASIVRYLDGASIILEDTFWGKKLIIKTEFGCR
ncbi:MAG: hypothetical protein PQJ61_02985 [Spirochaetales bacterium]|uniref:Uncharacterized protein n=1 Tax=Candidatus Thalassospirochaeta sargassi TaxID=3119039 RepID=A0AAJ1IAK4_9SPIO|nr:hypothetical protein [Spirochaetales bacterium]